MKTILNNISKRIAKGKGVMGMSLLAGTLSLTSCSDFLEILPLNEVVLENYWTKKDDVTSVLNGCYESLASAESVIRMGMWGEVRSENIVKGSSVASINNVNYEYPVNEVLKENILPTNTLADWSVLYTTINRCNTLIHYAPSVCEKDPNYTVSQMKANVAEAAFIRDLSYFYLIRAFREVPMTFEPSIDDTKDYALPATPMKEALKKLADDLESVKNDAVLRYIDDSRMTNSSAANSAYENCARVTRVAMYTLLADIYLWLQDYDKAIQCCDYVLNFKKQQYETRVNYLGSMNDMFEFNGVPMIREALENSKKCGNAYTEIFGNGFSYESIFELGLQNSTVYNYYVSRFYGNSSNTVGGFSAPEDYYQNTTSGQNDLWKKNDCRVYETITSSGGKFGISKYCNQSVELENDNVTDEKSLLLKVSRRNGDNINWIFYRLSDVMLIKAEALIMKGEAEFPQAFQLINAINKRARNYAEVVKDDSLAFATYSASKEKMEEILLEERKRELMFEGKRWFDLVRKSLRDGNSRFLADEATKKQKANAVAIKIQLTDPNAMFWPYSREELKKNPYLKQNPAYSDSEEFEK